jgi:hypothetical protein
VVEPPEPAPVEGTDLAPQPDTGPA